MSIEFRHSTPQDLPGIIRLLQTAFNAPPEAPFLNPKRLEWKYFDPISNRDCARSYVLCDGKKLLAHGCAWPVEVVFRDRSEQGVCLLDWVAAQGVPGVGVQFVSKLAKVVDLLISLGGSDDTRRVMPRIGFGLAGEQHVFARVLRPWKRFRLGPAGMAPKEIARLAMNTAYSLRPLTPKGDWTARETKSLSESCLSVAKPEAEAVSIHPAGLIDLMCRCPGVDIRCFELLRSGKPAGYAVTSLVNGQCRIAEIRTAGVSDDDRSAAVSAAVQGAQHPEACEVVAYASTPSMRRALQANGFRLRGIRPMFVRPAEKIRGLSWDLTMLDDDSSYLDVGGNPFVT